MRAKLFLFCALVCGTFYAQAQQVVVDGNMTPEQLIENVLFQGCIEISNVTSSSNGNINNLTSYGAFQRGASNFPFENGIVLTTGNVTDAGNPLNTAPLNEGETDWLGDADLESILGVSNTYNATSIEFDVIAASDQISFNYILASEEYLNDYPCNYSDSFAFLIKPTDGSAPYTNITLIPGTNTNVSTQNIRPEIVGFCGALNEEYFDGFNMGDTNYNGRTTVLTAQTTIQPNTSYHIKLVIADQFDENFDSAVFLEGNTFSTAIELGETINTCYNSVELNTGINNTNAIFVWDLDGTTLPDTTSTITATQSGTYHVTVTVPYASNQCIIEDSVLVNLNGVEDATPVTDLINCAATIGEQTTTFDLTDKNADLQASVPFENAEVKYYFTEEDALNNVNEITEPFENTTSPQMVYARIRNTDTDCLAYNSFNIIVNQPPAVTQPDALMVCGVQGQNSAEFNLSIAGNIATAGNSTVNVTYFPTAADAENNTNQLPTLYTSSINLETVFIKVTNPNTGCYSITSVVLHISYAPEVATDVINIDACEPEGNGYATFNLTNSVGEILGNNTNGYTVEYYLSETTAINGINPIPNPESFTNTLPYTQVIYVKVIDEATGCYTLATINIFSARIESETNTSDFSVCDDASNDGVEPFDLEELEDYILNGLEDVTVTFFTSQEDQINNVNALDKTVPFTNTANPQMLYLYIEKEGECSVLKEILLEVNPYFTVGEIPNQTYCDSNADGYTTIFTNNFTSTITNGNNYQVAYFLSESNAQNFTNPVTHFTNTSNPQQIWVAIGNSTSNCKDIKSFMVEVMTAPDTHEVSDMYMCDDNNDGVSTINLTSIVPELIDNTAGTTIKFYTSMNDATNDTNSIEQPGNYTTSTDEIFVRATKDSSGCYNVKSFMVYVTYFPELAAANASFMLCEDDSDETEGFVLEDYDNAIMQNEMGLTVQYFTSAANANANTNAINKSTAFYNTANPQTIYARRQSAFDASCYEVDPITIKVNSNPSFTAPTDMYLCDDISNDGFETFDLSIALDEMGVDNSQYTVNFYRTLSQANNNFNPLPLDYQNTVNPQTIWAKVETPQGCAKTVSFKLNVVHVGLINQPSPISYCDTNNDGYETVDLTSDDVDVLMIRQNEIILSYYTTETDAINLTNPITNPQAYNVPLSENGTPTTVYIVATNSISNCSLYVPLDITIYEIPEFYNVPNFEVCQNDISSLFLPSMDDLIIANSQNITITYFGTEEDAENGTNQLPETISVGDHTVTFYAKAVNTLSGCYSIKQLQVIVNQTPPTFSLTDMRTCSNEVSEFMDLTTEVNSIINTPANNYLQASYYLSEEEAAAETNAISTPSNYEVLDNDVIYARFENIETGCYSLANFTIHLDRIPEAPIYEDFIICPENPSLWVSAYTGNDNDTYVWSTGATESEIEITAVGVYSVTITSEYGCTSTKYFGVTASDGATIVDINTVSFTDNNKITIEATGSGNFMYILDGGTPQTSNVFENVEIGYHTIEVVDVNGCASAIATDIAVLGFPTYFTPNGDGANDQWNVFGFETLKDSYISIFDRYGKLIKVINPGDAGWDGTFNGIELPSNDYWFEANIKDTEEPFVYRDHFALKR